jgi:ubiquinone biosynthesis protein
MIPGAIQIDPQELAAIVPDCYAAFQPMVADGLMFFVQHLTPARLAEIFQAQAALPADAGNERRLVVFLHACPALHKVGQVLARNRHLDPELRRHLQELESLEPHTPIEELRPMLARELAPAVDRYRIRMVKRSLAEGSVAVVVPLTWSDPADGADAPPLRGVAKLLKPGVVDRLDEDLAILVRLAGYLEERRTVYGLPPLAYREILADVAELLTHEVRMRQEQDHLRRAARQLAGEPDVQIPRLLPFCTAALTAMERVDGCKITDPQAVSLLRRPSLFCSAVHALLSSVMFNRDESVLFHGDPHAGNLLATPEGRLAVLDWSLVGRLTANDRVHVAQILVGAWARDAARVAGAVAGLAHNSAAVDIIRGRVDAALAELPWYKLAGPAWAVGLLDAIVTAGVRFPARLLLFRKTFLTLQGVLADVWPAWTLETALMAEGLVQFVRDWPTRWWKPLDSRDYATRISSADLVHVAWRNARRLCFPATGQRKRDRSLAGLSLNPIGPEKLTSCVV